MPLLKALLAPIRSGSSGQAYDREARRELQRILESEFFRGTKRCRAFLRFVVEVALAGKGDQLKERTLGVEIFDRSPSYDTGEDAIVRVKATEIRRRLAQYNAIADPERPLRIELPPGSYIPLFHHSITEVPKAPVSRRSRGLVWAAILSMILLVSAGITYEVFYSLNPIRRFWNPVLSGSAVPIICLADPSLGDPSADLPGFPAPKNSPVASEAEKPKTEALATTNGGIHTGNHIGLHVPESWANIGDINAGILITSTLQSLGKASRVLLSGQVSFSDLKQSPVILIGAFTNHWTLSMTGNLRFAFSYRNGQQVIVDRDNASQFWAAPRGGQSTEEIPEDYAIVTRVLNSPSGQSLICAAGLNYLGTQAAGEFITNPRSVQSLIQHAPRNWENMNMQVVLKTKVVNDTPGPAEIVAVYFW